MANVKISQLPAATTIIPTADVAPIVHSGVTQKATPNLIVQSVLPAPGPIGGATPSTGVFTQVGIVGASGIQKAISGGLLTNAVAGTDYLGPTTGTAIQKANGSGGLTNAVSGTDYAPATSGNSILYGNSAGGFSNVTVGSGLTFTGGTLASVAGGGSVTTVSVVTANGLAGTVANPGSTPAITLSTTVTGLLKGNGTAISAAVSGTDYAPATSGTAILKGNGSGGFSSATAGTDYSAAPTGTNAQLLANNGSGGFSNVTVGSGLTYSAGTLSATGGSSGTVTTVSVVSANGLGGTVANATTTPAITLTTSVTGLLKGNGTGVSAAVSGTDYAPATSGSSILYGNGSGGFSSVTVGTGLSFSTGTLSATGGTGTVTSVSGTGTVNGLTLTGTVTTSGSLTLGGTLDLSSPPAIGGTTPAAITGTIVTANTKFVSSYFDASGSGGGALRTASGTACLQWGGGGGTNLTLDGAFNMNPANASISIAPTGTGTLTVNPATAGTIDNVAIGGTTAAAGKFTSLTATGTTTLATSLSGLLKTASGVVSAATAGTDYVAPGGALGTPSSGTLTNCTGLPISTGVSGLGTGVATALAVNTGSSGAFVVNGGALGTPSSGTLSSCTIDGTNAAGFRNIPQVSQSANYTTVLTDSGKHIFHPSTDTNARTFTIDSNANVAYPVGTAITFVNMSSSAVTIAITSDTMYLAGTGTTGSRTLAQYGTATALKIATTTWLINGNGLT